MRKFKMLLMRGAVMIAGVLLLGMSESLAQVSVSLPTLTGQVGTDVTINVTVGSLTGQNVLSYQFTVTYNTSILKITSVDIAGTITPGTYFVSSNPDTTNGRIVVAAAGSAALSGSGTLIKLKGRVVAQGTSALTFSGFQFNDGAPAAATTNGSVGVPSFAVRLPSASVTVGQSLSVAVAADDLTGKNIKSYQFTVSYDKSVVKLTGATIAGSITPSSYLVTSNADTANGRMIIAAAGTTNLSGAGTLITLTGTTAAVGTTAFTFSNAQFNDGDPAAAFVDGSVTVRGNSKPTFTAIAANTVAEGQALTFTVSATDPDGDAVTYSSLNLPSGATLNATSGAFAWTPDFTQSGTYNVVFRASDGLLTDSTTAQITVTNVNRKPLFVSRVPTTVSQVSFNVDFTFSVSASDPDGDALTFTWKANGTVAKTGADTFYTRKFTDPHGTARKVTAVFADAGGLSDSTLWDFTITDVEKDAGVIPTEFSLEQNYPNPFNPSTTIRFGIAREAAVTMEIYNMLGVKMQTLIAGNRMSAGSYTATWDGLDDAGATAPSGIYLYRITAGSFQAAKKMTLLK